jgi:hypothetical protein
MSEGKGSEGKGSEGKGSESKGSEGKGSEDKMSEDMNFKTPDDMQKKKNKNTESVVKQPAENKKVTKGDLPCQIKRVVFSKNSESGSENKSVKALKDEKSKGNYSARPVILHKPEHVKNQKQKPSTSREQSSKLEVFNNDPELFKETDDEELDVIRFSIHGDSSGDKSSDYDHNTEEPVDKPLATIKIPEFKISKTYDKRASSHNFRYI